MLKSTDKNNEINSISTGSTLEGNLNSKGDVRIDGQLNGSVHTEGRLVLGQGGVIEGEAVCESAIIAGKIKATITVKDILTLKSTAKLSGEIIASKLAIEPGAIFSGKCSMGPVVKNINKNEDKTVPSSSEKTA
ncbi:MAG: cell shape determination protein CcmA [Flavobacteriales bacterium]|jgi:cytoskeletal protein CcmA (bactofilin family)|nr:cell shape determination protein CcmA [Flavobacteriales bacterium]|tara:strand:- start:37259 stop:37660 length:402 start_codon:yes stop_codon:yes gene_type:complete